MDPGHAGHAVVVDYRYYDAHFKGKESGPGHDTTTARRGLAFPLGRAGGQLVAEQCPPLAFTPSPRALLLPTPGGGCGLCHPPLPGGARPLFLSLSPVLACGPT